MLKAVKTLLTKAGELVGISSESPMHEFARDYTSIVSEEAAIRLITGVGGWDSFVLIAESINISTCKESIVHTFIGDTATIELFNEHKVYLHGFTYDFVKVDVDKRGKPVIPKKIKNPNRIESFNVRSRNKTFMHSYLETYFDEMLTTTYEDIRAGELSDALNDGIGDSRKDVLIAKFVVHSAIQILAHDYQLYKTIN